jgi:hypothetical protein
MPSRYAILDIDLGRRPIAAINAADLALRKLIVVFGDDPKSARYLPRAQLTGVMRMNKCGIVVGTLAVLLR